MSGNYYSSGAAGDAFAIACWEAWTPGVAAASDWRAWLDGTLTPQADAKPDVSYLPAMLRRRLDALGRMALATAWPCVDNLDSFEYVFGSRHGSLSRTLELLVALIDGEPLSPSLFSLAVHNNVAGLFSIARGNRSAATAIAADEDTLAMTLLEAAGMIAAGAPQVLVTYAEDVAPEIYRPLVPPPRSHPFAVSLLLAPPAGATAQYALVESGAMTSEEPEAALIRLLIGDAPEAEIGVNQPWRLERRHDVAA